MTVYSKVVICDICHGSGTTEQYDYWQDTANLKFTDCGTCLGSGLLERVTEVTVRLKPYKKKDN